MVAKKNHSQPSRSVQQRVSVRAPGHLGVLAVCLVLIIAAITLYSRRNVEDFGPQLPPPPASAIYKQPNQPIEARVEDLLSVMTLEEKIGQMALVDKNSLGHLEDISKYYLGGVLSGAGAKPQTNTPLGWLEMVEEMKAQARTSRLGIPILYGVDANHGHANVLGATVFPHAIGLGATRNADLVEAVAVATSREVRATGINWSFSPSLDAPQDIRWGRVYEAFSENSDLNGKLGAAYITGTQAPDNGTFVLGSAKHYLGAGAMEWRASNHKKFTIDQGVTPVNEEALTNAYLPPYKAAANAGVASVMVGLNQWGRERVIDSRYLISEKLKTDVGFNGFVVSDWFGVYEYSRTNAYRSNVKTINAGLDMAMLPYDYKEFMRDVRTAVRTGDISQERIDDAVRRILYQKFRAGLFDVPSGNDDTSPVGADDHRAIARQAVAESVVLLKNSNAVLPLSKTTQRLYIAGSGADNVGRQSGAWTVEWQGVDGNWMPGGTSILQGIRQVAGAATVITFSERGDFQGAPKAEVGIAVVSEKPYAEGWGDSPMPQLSKEDRQAIEKLRSSADRVVVVMLSGRPLFISDRLPSWDAAVAAWLPGSEGAGVADVLFGDKPFKGTLPITWPATVAQLPVTGGMTKDGTPPLFRFGDGLID